MSENTSLKVIGLFYALCLLAKGIWGAYRNSLKANDLQDALVALGAGVFGILAALAWTTGLKPCPLCLAYWGSILLFILLRSNDRLPKMGILLASISFIGLSSVAILPATNSFLRTVIAAYLPSEKESIQPLEIGSLFPSLEGLPKNGYIFIITNCLPCHRAVILPVYRALCATRKPVMVVSSKELEGEEKENIIGAKMLDGQTFQGLQVDPEGSPFVYEINRGRIVLAQKADEFIGKHHE